MPDFIQRQIARISRNFSITALILAAVASTIAFFGWPYIVAVVAGPRVVSAAELASPAFQQSVQAKTTIVSVTGDQLRPSFYSVMVSRGKSGTAPLHYSLLHVGDKQLIVSGWSAAPSLTAEGEMSWAGDFILERASAYQEAGEILPLLVDTRSWKTTGWVLFGYDSIFALAALILISFPMRWNLNPAAHPVQRALAKLGEPTTAAMQLDVEMQAEVRRYGSIHRTQSMLVYAPAFKFGAVRLGDIVAATTEWRRSGKSSALYLILDTRNMGRVQWQIRNSYSQALLDDIRSAAATAQHA